MRRHELIFFIFLTFVSGTCLQSEKRLNWKMKQKKL